MYTYARMGLEEFRQGLVNYQTLEQLESLRDEVDKEYTRVEGSRSSALDQNHFDNYMNWRGATMDKLRQFQELVAERIRTLSNVHVGL